MNVKIQSQYAWTDSTIVLNWISYQPSVRATFVANRIAKIQENKILRIWSQVQTHEPFVLFKPEGTKEETKKSSQNITVMAVQLSNDTFIDIIDLSKHISFRKVTRINAFVLRFIENLREKQNRKTKFQTFSRT